jgi:hypothetical protein
LTPVTTVPSGATASTFGDSAATSPWSHRRQQHRDGRDGELPEPPGAQAQGEQRDEEQHRVELRGGGQPEQHACGQRVLAGPLDQAEPGERHRDQVPVGGAVQDQQRGGREHRGVPRAAAAGQPCGRHDDDQRSRREQHPGGVVEAARPLVPVRLDHGDRLGRDQHDRADDDRVLHRVLGVRRLAVDQPFGEVEREDVGVAAARVLVLLHPRVHPARRLLPPAEQAGHQREQDQPAQRRPEAPLAEQGVTPRRSAQRLRGPADDRVVLRGQHQAARAVRS